MKGKAKFKLSGGDPVLLCSHCSVILKYSRHFTEEEWKAYKGESKLPAQYCDKCAEQRLKLKEKHG
jgi:hypothetical protein